MEKLIYVLEEIEQSHRPYVGGKGANLGDMARGLQVPPGFCLSAVAYRNQNLSYQWWPQIEGLLAGVDLTSLAAVEQVSQQISRLIEATPFLPEVEQALIQGFNNLVAQGKFHPQGTIEVAVRSSATAEDMEDASFAGQQETYLNIQGQADMLEAVKKCWASLWTPRAIHYRHKKGYPHNLVRMAVIVQEMLPAEIAGVMFTANPVNNSREQILIEAVRGLGEALVSGESSGDSYTLQKEGLKLLEKKVADTQLGAMLPDFSIRELALAGVKIEKFYNDFQDVEWAFYHGQFYFLQARPITTLAAEEPPEINWEKLNQVQKDLLVTIQERFPEPIYPIDGAVVNVYFENQFWAMEDLGYYVPEVDWGRVKQGIFPEFFVPPAIHPKLLTKVLLLIKLPQTLRIDPAKYWEGHHEAFSEILDKLKARDFTTYPYEVIYRYLNDTFKQFGVFVQARYRLYTLDRLPQKILHWFLDKLFGTESLLIWENLVAGLPCITVEINEALEEIALDLRKWPEIQQVILEQPAETAWQLIPQLDGGKEFLAAYDRFIEAYGDRETTMGLGGLASPTWRESPEVVLGILKGLLSEPADVITKRRESLVQRRQQAEAQLAQRLKSGVWRWLPVSGLISRLVEHNRSFAIFRENSHYDLTKALNTFRVVFFKLGERLVRLGLLDKPEDVLYLTYDDIQRAIYEVSWHKKIDTREFRKLVATNSKLQEQRLAAWRTRKLKLVQDDLEQMQGIPASAGAITGTARIINSPDDFAKLQPGDILVAPYSNPAWTPLFATAAALVVDTGGAASHAAIIAREYGIPAVMGIERASLLIKDGEQITVNGSTGIVIRA